MASAFWTLEDGRGFSRRWSAMASVLKRITHELKDIKGADEFYHFLEELVYREEKGDEYNGYGGFIRHGEDIMFNFDLRTFAPENRAYFWQATQKALTRIKIQDDPKNEGIDYLLTRLLDMHKRIMKGEDPMLLNDYSNIQPDPMEKWGPGWQDQ